MATPIQYNTAGHAGVSTIERDLRVNNGGKRVAGWFPRRDLSVPETQRRAKSFIKPDSLDHIVERPGEAEARSQQGGLKTRKRHACDSDYSVVFETRWQVNEKGTMSLFLSRKPGYAHVEASPEKMDMVSTFHRERGLGQFGPLSGTPDNLCNDLFLTGTIESNTMDVLKPLGNRAEPYSNPDGPFETDPHNQHPAQIDHLDRVCIPRRDVPHVGAESGLSDFGKRRRSDRSQSRRADEGELVRPNPPDKEDQNDSGFMESSQQQLAKT